LVQPKHGVFAVLRVVFDLQIHGGAATGAKAKSDAGADRRELVRIRKLSGFSLGSCSLEKMLNNYRTLATGECPYTHF
jgi:hypothetical protein